MTITATCKYCGVQFEAERKTAQFCTDRHRVEYNLIGERIEKAAYRVLQDIALIETLYGQHSEFSEQARPLLETIMERARTARPRKPYTRQASEEK